MILVNQIVELHQIQTYFLSIIKLMQIKYDVFREEQNKGATPRRPHNQQT